MGRVSPPRPVTGREVDVNESTADPRRKQAKVSLMDQVITLLSAAGLEIATTDERHRARGFLVKDDPEVPGGVHVEWFVSLSLRQGAANEQIEGFPLGPISQLHRVTSEQMNGLLAGLLGTCGFDVTARDGATGIFVSPKVEPQGMVHISSVLRRIVGMADSEQRQTAPQEPEVPAPRPTPNTIAKQP